MQYNNNTLAIIGIIIVAITAITAATFNIEKEIGIGLIAIASTSIGGVVGYLAKTPQQNNENKTIQDILEEQGFTLKEEKEKQ